MNRNEQQIKIEITQDKLVDLLLHAATRDDIAKQDVKIDAVKTGLYNKIDQVEEKLSNKIDSVEVKLNNKIDEVEDRLNNKLDSFEVRVNSQFRWVLSTTLGVGVTLIGVMIGLASFLTHYISR